MSARFCGVIVIGVLFTPACFNPNYDHPTCGRNGECPSGLICNSQAICEPLPATCHRFGLNCPPGQICAADQPVCVTIGGCGDGVVESDEACDDGNITDSDGCSADCHSDETCGNGIADKHLPNPEECDHGKLNGMTADVCDISCHLISKVCGNGIIDQDMGEQCDPGNMDSANCNSNMAGVFGCKAPKCGDSYTNIAAGEKCDSGGAVIAQCNGPLCTLPVCGDSYTNTAAGEQCDVGGVDTVTCNGDTAGSARCHAALCGDGYRNSVAGEECDKGNPALGIPSISCSNAATICTSDCHCI